MSFNLNCCCEVACTVDVLPIPARLSLDFVLASTTPSEAEASHTCGEETESIFDEECDNPTEEVICPEDAWNVIHDDTIIDLINDMSPQNMRAAVESSSTDGLSVCCTLIYELDSTITGDDAAFAETLMGTSHTVRIGAHPLGSTLEIPANLICGAEEGCEPGINQAADTLRRTDLFLALFYYLRVCYTILSGEWTVERRLILEVQHGESYDSEGYQYSIKDLHCEVSDTLFLGAVAAATVLPSIASTPLNANFLPEGMLNPEVKLEGHYGAPPQTGADPPTSYWDNCDFIWVDHTSCCLAAGILCVPQGATCGGLGPLDERWYAVDGLEGNVTFL